MKNFIFIRYYIFLFILYGCGAQKNINGNVYKQLSDEANISNEDNLIRGIRIDDTRNDTLLVKYKIGNEIFLDADFIYDDKLKCYKTIDKIILGMEADEKSVVYLTFDGIDYLYLEFIDVLKNKKIGYQKVYKMKVDLKTHRDPYYAEDGFSLYTERK